MIVKATVRVILLGAALGLCLIAVPAPAAELRDVRVGIYDTFTRIVFEFDGPVQFRQPDLQGQGSFTVRFINAESDLTDRALQAKTKGLARLKILNQAPHLVADVGLPFTHLTLKAFTLTGPQRVVVDAYKTKPPAQRITIKDLVIKESLQPATPQAEKMQPASSRQPDTTALPAEKKAVPKIPQVTTAQKDPPPNVAATQSQATQAVVPQPPKQGITPKLKKANVQRNKKNKEPFLSRQIQSYLTIALIVIGCGIVILIGIIFFQKRRPPKAVKRTKTDDGLQSSADVMAAIDAKIKEKLQKYK
jgi:hypothetical protein